METNGLSKTSAGNRTRYISLRRQQTTQSVINKTHYLGGAPVAMLYPVCAPAAPPPNREPMPSMTCWNVFGPCVLPGVLTFLKNLAGLYIPPPPPTPSPPPIP